MEKYYLASVDGVLTRFAAADDTEALLRAGGESVRRVAFVYNITDDHLVYERFTGK